MEEDSVQRLTVKDFEGIEVNPNWSRIEYLAAIAERALFILDHGERRKKDKGKQKLSGSDNLNEQEQTRKKMIKRETLKPRLSKEVCDKEFSERVIKTDRETLHRVSEGICIRDCSEGVIRKSDQQSKKKEDSLLSREQILRRERLLKRPTVETDSESEYQEPKMIKKNKKIIKKLEIDHGPNPPPELSREFREALEQLAEGKCIKDLKLVIQKGLFGTDISKGHNRLSMPSRHLLHPFLSEDEIKELEAYSGKNVKAIEADIIEPSLEKGKVSLRRWAMRKNSGNESVSYVLTGTWNSIVSRNSLAIGDVVQVWSVRVDEQLCFLLVRLPSGGDKFPISTTRVPDTERPSVSPSDPSEPGPSALALDPSEPEPGPGESASTSHTQTAVDKITSVLDCIKLAS